MTMRLLQLGNGSASGSEVHVAQKSLHGSRSLSLSLSACRPAGDDVYV